MFRFIHVLGAHLHVTRLQRCGGEKMYSSGQQIECPVICQVPPKQATGLHDQKRYVVVTKYLPPGVSGCIYWFGLWSWLVTPDYLVEV